MTRIAASLCALALSSLFVGTASAQTAARTLPGQTTIDAAGGPIVVSPFMHASVQIEHGGRVIQLDPAMGDQSAAKSADLVLVTDVHEDHLNAGRIAKATPASSSERSPAAASPCGCSTGIRS